MNHKRVYRLYTHEGQMLRKQETQAARVVSKAHGVADGIWSRRELVHGVPEQALRHANSGIEFASRVG